MPDTLADYLEALPEPHILCSADYRIVAANRAYRQVFGTGQPVVGRTCHEVSHHSPVPCDRAGETCPLAAARLSGRRERVLHLHQGPRGEQPVQIDLVPLPGPQGRLAWFVERMLPLPELPAGSSGDALVGRSAPFRRMLDLVARVAPSAAPVLLLGESGTGKEGVARALHAASERAARPLVVADCAAMPEALFEAELFGHERGAYTGAVAARGGLVEAASGGTLFLDEVGDIPLPQQVKLLRLLESGTYRRVGSTTVRHADLRVVSATHRDLAQAVADGRFREDLYHRLAVFPIHLPPLRQRPDDLPELAAALLARVAPGRPLTIAADALALLAAQPWPGNVRELRNVLERAALLCDGRSLTRSLVQQALGATGAPPAAARAAATPPPLARAGHDALRRAVAGHTGTRDELARELGISPRTLYRKLRALG